MNEGKQNGFHSRFINNYLFRMVNAVPMTPPIAPKTRALIGARMKSFTATEGSTVTVSTQAGQSEYTTGIDGRAKLGGRKLNATATSSPMAAKVSRNLKETERFDPSGLPIVDSVHEAGANERQTAIIPTMRNV